jgi:hypothetical protein
MAEGSASGGETVAFATPWQKRWALVSAGVVMTAASAWLWGQSDAGVVRFVGVPGVVFFSTGLLYALYRALRPRPAVILDDQGFVDHASAVGVGRVSWLEVDAIQVVAVSGRPMVSVVLRDRGSVFDHLSWWKRTLLGMNRRLPNVGDVNIPASVLPVPAVTFAREMERRRQAAV